MPGKNSLLALRGNALNLSRMSESWETIQCDRADTLAGLPAGRQSVVLISSGFDPGDKARTTSPQPLRLSSGSVALIEESVRVLREGGLLFVYGLPRELTVWGEQLHRTR